MQAADYINPERMIAAVQNGYVDRVRHRNFPLSLYTYSRKTVQENAWDEVTTRCRGLIVDDGTGAIIARPFEKFFNLDTESVPETHYENLPTYAPIVTEKLDGSLGIGYTYHGQFLIASKGSFHSPHAEWASNWFRLRTPNPQWPDGYTPVFEMICEGVQHHVVHYGRDRLVLTALINKATGEELDTNHLMLYADRNQVEPVIHFASTTLPEVLKEDCRNEEGYVLTWPRPGREPLRVKVKFPTFLRLQRLMHGVGPKQVFEFLRNGEVNPDCPNCEGTGDVMTYDDNWVKCHCTELLTEWMSDATPEFCSFIQGWKEKLENYYNAIFKGAATIYMTALQCCTTRKEFAAFFQKPEHVRYAAICFALLDETKDYRRPIWKLVEPMVKGCSPMSTYDMDGE